MTKHTIAEIILAIRNNLATYLNNIYESDISAFSELPDERFARLSGYFTHIGNSDETCRKIISSDVFIDAVNTGIIKYPFEQMNEPVQTVKGVEYLSAKSSRMPFAEVILEAQKNNQVIYPYLIGLVNMRGETENYYAVIDKAEVLE